VVLMETVTDLRMTSDEAPLRRGGGMQYAPLALPRESALRPVLNLIQDLIQGCLLYRLKKAGRKGFFEPG
jgi:hypothetical protein